MKHLIVGTAGHVDHGKTALIRALTGIDTDRLQEEKKRGISIDIGFAALRYDDGLLLGIVDVPGHERFLKNMLAGTGGIDLVLLVIAADEGIMPQTREHFEMLQCLGIRHGIVVLNKIDKVDAEWLMLVEEDVRNWLSGTFLDGAPLCRASAVTGEGLPELRQTLREAAEKVRARDSRAPFRMWIDRAFNLKGQGLIVTGSVLSGTLRTGDPVRIYPAEQTGKVRELESHNQATASVAAGQRASVNLTGINLAEVGRGMFLSSDGIAVPSLVWDAAIQWRTRFPSGTRIRFHIGTGEFIGRMSYAAQGPFPEIVRLHLEEPVAGACGDKGLVRRYSPQDLMGGITLLWPGGSNHKRDERLNRLYEALRRNDLNEVLLEQLLLTRQPPTRGEWAAQAGYLNEREVQAAQQQLVGAGRVLQAGQYYVAADQLGRYEAQLQELLRNFHREKPAEPGLSREILRQRIGLPANIAEWFLKESERKGLTVLWDEYVAAASHAAAHGQKSAQLRQIFEAVMNPRELIEITPEWLAEKMQRPISEIKPFFEALTRDGTLVRIAGVHVYRKTIQYIGSLIQQHFATKSTLSVGEFRDLLNITRRLAVPLLEFLDTHKYTIRREDVRLKGPNLTNLSE